MHPNHPLFQSYSLRQRYLIFSISLFFSFGALAGYGKICADGVIGNGVAEYSFLRQNLKCQNANDCWMQFKAPEDRFSVKIDGVYLFDIRGEKEYFANEYFLVPLPQSEPGNKIEFFASDTNHNVKFPKLFCLRTGRLKEVRWLNAMYWFANTGSTLFSAYFLFLISIFLLFSFWIRKTTLGVSLLTYSIVSIFYLISFSEYPRSWFDPVTASGGYHFPLRLLQDLCLVFVFYNVYQKYDASNIIKKLSYVYSIVIFTYILLLLIGVTDYVYHARIIMIMAPLVAAPMAIGAWFAFKLPNPVQRKVLVPISLLLLAMQLNDLFVFWGLLDGYFTVRLYIPFIVGMALYIYFMRMHEESVQSKTSLERQKIFKEFVHDVRSPLSVLRTFLLSGQRDPDERSLILESALDRVEGMVSQVDSPHDFDDVSKISLMKSLEEIVAQKRLEIPDLKINLQTGSEVFSFVNKTKIQRVFSNIINNAYESYLSSEKLLDISFDEGEEEVRIRFSDKGKGIPRSVYQKLFTDYVSTKEKGSGIGLKSAYDYLRSVGGSLDIISKENVGTTVEIKLNVVLGTFDADSLKVVQDEFIVMNPKSFDFILIDDDKYIRLSWEYFAKNSNKKIRTFSNVESFLEVATDLDKGCSIYLDLNINGEKTTKYLDEISKLGFKNIILATGEKIESDILPKGISRITGKLPPH